MKAIIFLGVWAACGYLGVLLDNIRPRTQYEAAIDPIRGTIGGLITVLWVLFLWFLSSPSNDQENEIY